MKTIKQPDNWSCVICCMQMVTLCEREEAVNYALKMDTELKINGIDHYKMTPFLFERGILLGSVFEKVLAQEGHTLDDVSSIQVEIEFWRNPFLLSVKSWRFKDKLHLVLWDGFHVRDPNPDAPEKTKLSQYDVVTYDQVRFMSPEIYERFIDYYRD